MLTRIAMGLAVAGLVAGCGRRDGAGTEAAASPGTGAYASPVPGAEGGVGVFTDSMEVTADVIGVDEDAKSITVTAAETGPPADRPGADDGDTDEGANQGVRGTAGAIADRRTLPVGPAAVEMLSRLKPGDRVTLSCTTDPAAAGTTGGASGGSLPGPSGTIPSPGLEGCATVAAITSSSDGSSRGR
jgi:hypothetical protein